MVETVVNPHTAKWAHLQPNQHCTLTVDPMGNHEWKDQDGYLHRVDAEGSQDGPARISTEGALSWFRNGRRHRVGGPACDFCDGYQAWYLNGASHRIEGDVVVFGTDNGAKTLGKVLKVNSVKYKVEQLEARNSRPVGTIWTVPGECMTLAPSQQPIASLQPPVTRAPVSPPYGGDKTPAQVSVGSTVQFAGPGKVLITAVVESVNSKTCTVKQCDNGRGWRVSHNLLTTVDPRTVDTTRKVATKRQESEILRDIQIAYGNLSPENLSCDGERSRSEVLRRYRALNAKLRTLFQEIGRNVSEDEAWAAFGKFELDTAPSFQDFCAKLRNN